MIVLFFVVANLGWIARDTTPMPVVDSYTQASNVLEALHAGVPTRPQELATFLSTLSQGGRPPIYQLITIPFAAVFGTSVDALVAVNLLFLIGIMWGAYGTSKVIANRAGGLVAMVAVACFAPLVKATHQYRSYYGAYAFAALTAWACALLLRHRRRGPAWLAVGCATLALLTHPLAVLVVWAPLASTWLQVTFAGRGAPPLLKPSLWRPWLLAVVRDPLVSRVLVPATALPVLACWGWYLHFGRGFLVLNRVLGSDWVASYRGYRVVNALSWIPPDLRWYGVSSVYALSMPLSLAVAVGAVYLALKGGVVARLLVVWLAAAYLSLGIHTVLHWAYGALALPLVAAILGASTGLVSRRWVRRAAIGLVVGVSLLNFSIVAWGWPRLPGEMARSWGILPGPRLVLLSPQPATSGYWPIADAVGRLCRDTGEPRNGTPAAFTVTPSIRSAAYRFYRLRFWPQSRLSFASQGAQLWGAPFPVSRLLRSRWVVQQEPLSQWCETPQLNMYRYAAACLLMSPPEAFSSAHRLVDELSLPNGGRLVVLERIQPLTLGEIDETTSTLRRHLEPKYLTEAAVLAASVLVRQGRSGDAAKRLREAAAIGGQPPKMRANILARLGVLQVSRGERKLGLDSCRQAVALAPGDAAVRTRLGLALAKAGDVVQAREVLLEASRLSPEFRWPRQILQRLNGGGATADQ